MSIFDTILSVLFYSYVVCVVYPKWGLTATLICAIIPAFISTKVYSWAKKIIEEGEDNE